MIRCMYKEPTANIFNDIIAKVFPPKSRMGSEDPLSTFLVITVLEILFDPIRTKKFKD